MDSREQDRARNVVETFGTRAQRARFAERRVVMAVSEPDAGSDVAAITAKAVRDGDDFIIDGQKKYIAGVADAEYLAVVVRTDREGPPQRQLSTILVPLDADGVEVQPILDMLGRHHSDKVFFTGVRVPVADLLGEEGRGWHQQAASQQGSIESLGQEIEASLLRTTQEAVPAASRRHVADNAVRAAVARGIGTARADQGDATAHLFAAETLQRLAATEFSLAGIAGLMRECNGEPGAAVRVVDAASATVEFGTAELLRNAIARSLGLG